MILIKTGFAANSFILNTNRANAHYQHPMENNWQRLNNAFTPKQVDNIFLHSFILTMRNKLFYNFLVCI
jgi:hypothetical protein